MRLDKYQAQYYYHPYFDYGEYNILTTWSCIRSYYLLGLITQREFEQWFDNRSSLDLERLFEMIDWELKNNRRSCLDWAA